MTNFIAFVGLLQTLSRVALVGALLFFPVGASGKSFMAAVVDFVDYRLGPTAYSSRAGVEAAIDRLSAAKTRLEAEELKLKAEQSFKRAIETDAGGVVK